MKRLFSMLIILTLVVGLLGGGSVFAEDALEFSDLPDTHWSYPYVKYMVDNGIVTGYPDGTFRPNDPFSRAAFATLLYKSFNLTPATDIVIYNDLPETHWAYTYIQGARQFLTYYDMDDGYYFEPTEHSVREDVAVAMVIAAGIDELYAPDHNFITSFNDYDDISPQLRDYVALAVELGIMKGSGTEFNPQAPLSRAEACTVFAKYAMDVKDQLKLKIKTNNIEAIIAPTSHRARYILKEIIPTEKGAYYNTELNYKKVIEHKDGEAIVQIYDHDFDRGNTPQTGYDVRGVIKWSGIPQEIIPNESYTINLSLELTKNHNPEEAYIEILTSAFDLYLNDDNSAYYGVFILDNEGYGQLSAGLPEDGSYTQGGSLNLVYKAPDAGIDRIAIKIESGDGFEYLYIYEWVE